MTSRINPIAGNNRLKVGVFNFNGDGNSRTLVPERCQFNWENSLDVAQQADRLKLEAIVPYARFRSLVDPGHKSASTFESLDMGGSNRRPIRSTAAS